MAHAPLTTVLQHIRRLLGSRPAEEEADGRLLERFARGQEQSAFAALMARHGPMVLGVCRRVLHDEHDAEDVFQATFVVLARKARSLDGRGSVASWLYTVAHRLALRARTGALRRQAQERQAVKMLGPDASTSLEWRDLRPVLDDALRSLPEKYRAPLVLCYLEGKTTEEAARQLGCPFGTVSSRLARGRDLLRARLTRRGVSLSAAALGALLVPEALAATVPANLLGPTLQAATLVAAGQSAAGAGLSASVVTLVEGAFRDMMLAKVKIAAVMLLSIGLLGLGAGVVRSLSHAETAGEKPAAAAEPEKPAPPIDLYGDPLPAGVLARIGTIRLQHPGGIQRCTFLPDNRTLATGGLDGTIRLWDAETGKDGRDFRGHTSDIRCIAFTRDGKKMASASWDQTVRLWDVASGKQLHSLAGHRDAALHCIFSPDGKTVVTSDRGKALRQWDVATGKELPGFVGHENFVITMAYSPDGRMLVSGGFDKTVRLWEVATCRERQSIPLPANLRGVEVSPDGKMIALDLDDRTVRVQDVATGKQLHQFIGHQPFTYAMTFSPDGKTLMTGSHDQRLCMWDLTTANKPIDTKLEGLAGAIAFSPDGKRLACGSDTSIRFWDPASYKEVVKAPTLAVIKAVSLSPDGNTLATAGGDSVIRLWDAGTGKEIRPLTGHTGEVVALAFAPDGKMLTSGSVDGTIRQWDPETGKQVKQWAAHTGGVTVVTYSRDGLVLATGGADKAIRLWEGNGGKEIKALSGHTQPIAGLAFAPDGKTLASAGGLDCTVRLWDVTAGKEIRMLVERPAEKGASDGKRRAPVARCVAFAPDGKTLAVAGDFWTRPILRFNVATGQELPPLQGELLHNISALTCSPDGKTLAVAGWGSNDVGVGGSVVRLWEMATGKPARTLNGHFKPLTSISFSTDGKRMASGSLDRTALVWDLSRAD